MFGNHGLCGLLDEGAHGKSPKCLGGNLGDFGEFCKGLRPFLLCQSSSSYFTFMTQQSNQIADTFFHGTAIDDLVDCALLQ